MQSLKTLQLSIKGVVQGVGFRPFVYKIATKYDLKGYVLNDGKGVLICIQGDEKSLDSFLASLKSPPRSAKIHTIVQKTLPTKEIFKTFCIKTSMHTQQKEAVIPADIALCKKCKRELFNPKNRRYLYPFISCMDCGGRYSLINALPYDRHQTTMAEFRMCEKCKKEYENPLSRRFHSQINCCSNCGPKLFFTRIFKQESFSMYVPDSKIHSFLEGSKEPLSDAIHALKNGEILALKGVGGYTLVCDATNKDSIRRLRLRKNRPTKPFAIMCKDIKMARLFAVLKPKELNLLTSCIAPIVLSKSKNSMLPLEDVAPNLSTLGIILPYAPLHYLLFKSLDFPLIFTSANLSGEPIIKDYYQIHQKLSAVCDAALFYDRDISNPVDDSLVRVISDEIQVLRRARGYLCDIPLECEYRQNAVALGAQQKVTFTFCHKNKVLLSPHLGDLDNLESFENAKKTLNLFSKKYEMIFDSYILDSHPKYLQRNFITPKDKVYFVQHHFAHLLSNIAENAIDTEVLGVIFDGTGYGLDGRIWGGEFLWWDPKNSLDFKRLWSFEPFYLLGGEGAIKDPRKLALEACFRIFKEEYGAFKISFLDAFKREYGEDSIGVLYRLHKAGNQPLCQSVGRIFDMVAAFCGVIQKTSYEGEGGMILESLAFKAMQKCKKPRAYSFEVRDSIIFWFSMMKEIYQDLKNGVEVEQISLNFHYTLVQIIKSISCQKDSIALSGGCFQNAILTQLVVESLRDKKVFLNHEIPCNDGGISFGQAYFMQLLEKKH